MDPMVLILGIGFALAGVLLVVGIVVTTRSEKSIVEERLGRYLDDEPVSEQKQERASPLGEWLNNRLTGSKWGDNTARALARADIKLKPSEYISMMVIVGIGVAALAWFFGGRSILVGVIGFLIGTQLPRLYVGSQQSKRLIKFDEQLADMLNLMVNGLRAGYSTMQAMEAVSKEMPSPISDEFRRVVQEMQLGIPMEKALDNLIRRIPSLDLDLVIAAVNVQREVGGNLAEILDTISYTIRERVRIKGEIRVLTSQVMYSGRFLAMMPLIIAGILWMLNRPYMMRFFAPETRIPGMIALGIALGMIGAGYFVMNKIGQVEV